MIDFKVGDRVVCGGPGKGRVGKLVITTTHPLESFTVNMGDGERFYTTDASMLTTADEPDTPRKGLVDTKQMLADIEAQISGPTWVAHDEMDPPQHTHTATFELPDGRQVSIPEPGEGWEADYTRVPGSGWNKSHVVDALTDGRIRFNGAGFQDVIEFNIKHDGGLCWLGDMARVLNSESARVLSVTRWKRWKHSALRDMGETTLTYETAYEMLGPNTCPSTQPLAGDWSGKHPRGAVRRNG